MFDEVRPFDWVMLAVEILVLLLIAYEVGIGLWRNRKTRNYLSALHGQMRKGLDLQTTAPSVGMGETDAVRAWLRAVPGWVEETNTLLSGYSAQASASFLHKPHGEQAGRENDYRGIYHYGRLQYAELVERLNNLRTIMEKPDVYL